LIEFAYKIKFSSFVETARRKARNPIRVRGAKKSKVLFVGYVCLGYGGGKKKSSTFLLGDNLIYLILRQRAKRDNLTRRHVRKEVGSPARLRGSRDHRRRNNSQRKKAGGNSGLA
jgi:hypothetical protein